MMSGRRNLQAHSRQLDDERRRPLGREAFGRERGQAMVEFTLVIIPVLLICFAIVQFGLMLHDYVTLTHAADVGARVASVSRDQPNGVTLARNATIASASGLNSGQMNVTVTPQPWSAGSQITVQATYPYSVNILGIVVTSGNLTAQTSARAE
jgi:Flp pilus assembly protein TadG